MLNGKLIKRALQLFIRFLKEEKIIGVFNKNYSMFLKQHNKQKYVKYNGSYNSYLLDIAQHGNYYIDDENIYSLFLDYPMTWVQTEKGFEFWANVNKKWKEYFFNNFELIKKEINEK